MYQPENGEYYYLALRIIRKLQGAYSRIIQYTTFDYYLMTKRLLSILGVLLFLALGFSGGVWLTRKYYGLTEQKIEEQSTVLLEKVKTVAKLISVEGYYSEVYDHKTYWAYNISLFQKKALIRVKAKVSVGYDLSKMNIESDQATRTILISKLPEAEILSIDHDLDYYDISEGVFNAFTPQDYTRLNKLAKSKIEESARKGDLFKKAEEQGNQMLEVIELMVESTGWKVVYKGDELQKVLD